MDFEWREGSGLWGRVEYTARAAKLIEDGEYLYFSTRLQLRPGRHGPLHPHGRNDK
ncbi:phage protease [Pseudomonas aeruginosa]|nr:phage protease [Pseudomonas aeruginosa]WMF54564.1 phage protease [Pseudomonas aeruginosa]